MTKLSLNDEDVANLLEAVYFDGVVKEPTSSRIFDQLMEEGKDGRGLPGSK